MNWTVDQRKAIEARNGTLLVSAAAGSGKTAVLVERVIQRLCGPEKPCEVENLLIVTFTNAAAAQMKEKISAAIGKKAAEEPENKRLRRLQMMLPCADICTIDSFCIGLVRENFHALGISPDFELIDEGKLGILCARAVENVVEKLYENPTESFLALCELIGNTGDDKKLVDAIIKLYSLSQAYPFPEPMLKSLADEFNSPLPVEESVWGKIILDDALRLVASCLADSEYCIRMLSGEPELEEKYRPAFENDKILFEELFETFSQCDWDTVVQKCEAVSFARMAAAPRGYESAVKDMCKTVRDNYKAEVKKLKGLFCVSSDEHRDDVKSLAPVVAELINAVLKFDEEFKKLKAEENGADFSDTLHLALKLLVEPTDNGYQKTKLAHLLSENYEEILVDEYQDVNKAQDMIFAALSKNENNLFMVGDVKQSIYRFRQAMPEIFLARRDAMSEYENENYPAKVTLGKNFRSRSGITQIVNFIFGSLMSRNVGGLDYDKNEFLEAGASYPPRNEADTNLCIFETEKENFSSAQAKYVADYIENAISSGMTFGGEDNQRPAEYRDFCVLLRSVKNSSEEFIKELSSRGIPVSCEAGDSFLTSPEIMFMISLLKVTDNPVDDIPLTTVLLSPIFGFTPDDLAYMRARNRSGSVYHCLVCEAESQNSKALFFLEKTKEYRRLAATLGAGEFVRRLTEETGYGAIVSTMRDSAKRRANLNSFIDLANKYESMGQRGISGFIRYIDNLTKSGVAVGIGNSDSENANSVKIMTVHKSKGLEFPVCFLASCEKKYSDMSLREDLLIAGESGIGIRNASGNVKFDTLPRISAKLEIKKAERSEELRVLYVALTRPKEKLIILSSSENTEAEISKIAANIRDDKQIDPYKVIGFKSYAECILSALIRHPDAHALRNAAGIDSSVCLDCQAPLDVKIISAKPEEIKAEEAKTIAPLNENIVKETEKRLNFVYPYSELSGIVAKRIASKLDKEEIGGEYFASRRPAFVGKDKLTPAQRGTATHRFMQFADYRAAKQDVQAELHRLVDMGMLTRLESGVVDLKSITDFLNSPLANRILSAEKVYKEYSFTCALPLCEVEPSISPEQAKGEVVVVEGVADCAFVENGELVIVDFKTDKANSAEELVEKYYEQLSVYRRCLSEVLALPVKQTLIYSFRLNQTVQIR